LWQKSGRSGDDEPGVPFEEGWFLWLQKLVLELLLLLHQLVPATKGGPRAHCHGKSWATEA